ncbi:sugar phosphate isomerase/epimerase [Agromyces sp. ISL-38]|uniref:sugar phosphate isomerase/epimerase family protein n=1 Tax=Agromyces sp. ISL-38 TaxID=2819107 RepID=UPI001BE594B4|nr:sugar phosphate isomerase/epimerase [Agromyces sp. ISL-38]MBT2499618.1 sugar phosphate isomerase/epimerase [Agromyces sp. ISL-38]MBT2516235.1 sugar phosphate isomerase/epimerase [Streptomyces sp. ISL-90]
MIRIGMSTTCVYPLEPEHAFRLAKLAGFDGIEIMVTQEESTQQAEHLLELSRRYALPILTVHAPVLLLTHFVWGRDPRVKLERTAELAAAVGAESVVVHPPFRWQATYALEFLRIVREISAEYGVVIAVENMFPWRAAGKNLKAYAPGWDPRIMDCDAVTLDFSHAALSGVDSLEFANDLGARLRHVHLCDGSGAIGEGQIFDEHLLPGYGREPVAEVLEALASRGWSGSIVAEVNTRKARSERERLELLRETLEFARTHTHQSKRRRALIRSRRALEAILPGSRH